MMYVIDELILDIITFDIFSLKSQVFIIPSYNILRPKRPILSLNMSYKDIFRILHDVFS